MTSVIAEASTMPTTEQSNATAVPFEQERRRANLGQPHANCTFRSQDFHASVAAGLVESVEAWAARVSKGGA
jgi:hypothetical protein